MTTVNINIANRLLSLLQANRSKKAESSAIIASLCDEIRAQVYALSSCYADGVHVYMSNMDLIISSVPMINPEGQLILNGSIDEFDKFMDCVILNLIINDKAA